MSHYIAMNRFRIVKGQESEFEEIWKTRNTYLESEPGFIKFNLLKGPENEKNILPHGPNPKPFVKPTPVRGTGDTFTLATPNLKVLELSKEPRFNLY